MTNEVGLPDSSEPEAAAPCEHHATITASSAQRFNLPADLLIPCLRTRGHDGEHFGTVPRDGLFMRWPSGQ